MVDGFTEDQIGYHCMMLRDAGMMNASDLGGLVRPYAIIPRHLTWEGHEFLNSIRSDSVWTEVKETARKNDLVLTIGTVRTIVEAIIKGVISNQ